MSLLAELKRRKVFKVGVAYLVAAWLAVQAASIGFPAFDAPPWALRVFILVALLGIPMALVMAWVLEVTPEGLKFDAAKTGSKRVLASASLLVLLALGWFFLEQPLTRTSGQEPQAAVSAPGAAAGAAQAVPLKSIAVLPFTDLSPDRDQEYFSDGVAEEILNALAKIKDLKVAGRSSSFSFKGKSVDLRDVGRTLAVAHVLEGSVRKQGTKVRVAAELIRTGDGYDVWSESYDGDLSDIFELQERIARAITDTLQVILQGDQRKRLIPVATGNPEAYALYLQATGIFNRREGARWPDAMKQMEQAVRLDPKYARAHSRLAALAVLAPQYANFDWDAAMALAEEHAKKASALDPTLAEPHAVLGQVISGRRHFLESRQELERAIELDPDDATAAFWDAAHLILTGYCHQGYAVLDRLLAVDPMLPTALLWRGMGYAYDGDNANAERLLQRAADAKLAFAGLGLSLVAEARQRKTDAIEQLVEGLKALRAGLSDQSNELLARGMLGDEEDRRTALAMIDRYLDTKPAPVSRMIAYSLMRMHEPARALALAREQPARNDVGFLWIVWTPYGREVRAQPDFPEFVRSMGLAALWDRYGEPDYCRRLGAGNYTCE